MFPEALNAIINGFTRLGTKQCSKWAENYRILDGQFAGPWTFNYHPWLIDIHDAEDELIVSMKAAQMGLTETALNRTFYTIDIKHTSVLYVLPASKPDATDFSTSRFDPALELSPHLKSLFGDVRNIGHKRAGGANLFIRGSRSRSQLKSLPVSSLVFDEVAEMNQKSITLASERISGHLEHDIFMLSTPTTPKDNIHSYFLLTTQDKYWFRCPHCSKFITLTPDELIVCGDNINDPDIRKTHIVCSECRHILDHAAKPEYLFPASRGGEALWRPTITSIVGRGFYINQLYSSTVTPVQIAQQVFKAKLDPADEQELYNSKFGLPHATSGAKVTDDDIKSCIGNYKQQLPGDSTFVTMGIDVGKMLHVEIDAWYFSNTPDVIDVNLVAKPKVIKLASVEDFGELYELINRYKPRAIVIDAQPERRKSLELCNKYYGHAYACFYGRSDTSRQIAKHEESEHLITVNRTSWMDMALGRFQNRSIRIPADTPLEYKDHVKAPTKITRRNKDGNIISEYVIGNEADHFAHARTYSEIALKMGLSMLTSQTISGNVI